MAKEQTKVEVVVPVEVLGVKPGTYEGHEYTTLTLRVNGNDVVKATGIGGVDFEPYKDKGVVQMRFELRSKNDYLALRALGAVK